MLSTFARASTRSLATRRLVRAHATAIAHDISAPSQSPIEDSGLVRTSWTKDEIREIYHSPLLNLVFRAAAVHRKHFDPSKVQLCTLMNIKTGGCTEDCSYCSQSSRYSTPTSASRLLQNEPVIQAARKAKENGSTRFCMGAAWRDLQGRKSGFNRILEMVAEIRGMGMEVCTTLGMLSPEQARQLKQAGLTAYNHNLDTSREFYPKVITTRSYDERLATIEAVQDAGINVCSGGILGLGETDDDRIGLIWEVANMRSHPESFPVNALVPIPGTPLERNGIIPHRTILRTIATARIALPSTIIRLSAGRDKFSEAEQAMCFMAGANAVFTGEKMLTTPCASWDDDKDMFGRWGLEGMRSFEQAAIRFVDFRGNTIFDSFVQPTEPVVIYKPQMGIEEWHISPQNPESLPFDVVQAMVNEILNDRIIIGHSLWTDLAILGIRHCAKDTRDLALYIPFREAMKQQNQIIGMPTLVLAFMNRNAQCGYTNSLENSRACLDLFRCVQESWENFVSTIEDWPCLLPPPQYAQYYY